MKKRIGDRRGRARFEIVGTLTGTLETWRWFQVRNIGPGGALVEGTVPLPPGTRIGGRMLLGSHGREVRGEIKHIAAATRRDQPMRYQIGLQWESAARIDDLIRMETMKAVQSSPRHGPERRADVRLIPGVSAEIGQPAWSTVELVDISTTGVLCTTTAPIDVGERGELRVRLGQRSFAAQIEVRRTDARSSTSRFGAAFVSLDEGSRLHLEEFIGDARH